MALEVNNVLTRLHDNTEKLQQKEQESNALLENILPKTIAERWKKRETLSTLIADNIQQITVVSARIVGILDLGKDSNPEDQAELLQRFSDR